MTLQEIEAFVALAETGSVNRAALRLHLTQPATTRRIQNFEAAMGGAALLDRNTKPPALTPAGRQVLESCRRVLKAVRDLRESGSDADPAGDLRVGIAHGLGGMVLGSPLDHLRRRHPGLRLQVSSDWTSRLIEAVRDGSLDCAVGLVAAHHAIPAQISAAAVGSETVVVLASRALKLPGAGRDGLRLRELADHVWILNPVGCGCRAALQRALDAAHAPLRVAAEVLGEDVQLSMVARGAGLGLAPRRELNHSPHKARLRVVKVAAFSSRSRCCTALLWAAWPPPSTRCPDESRRGCAIIDKRIMLMRTMHLIHIAADRRMARDSIEERLCRDHRRAPHPSSPGGAGAVRAPG